jgi:GAF domain-containing protein
MSMDDFSDKNVEQARLMALQRFAIQALLSSREAGWIVDMTATKFAVKAVSLAFMDKAHLRFKPKVPSAKGVLPRSEALCRETIESGRTIVVEDLTNDPGFSKASSVVNPPHLRFFASAPITFEEEFRIGALVLVDTTPREFPAASITLLESIATHIVPWLLNPKQGEFRV